MLHKAKSADNKKRKLFNNINVPDDDAPALPLPRIGVGLLVANRVEGKVATNFDVGDIIHVEYIGDGLMIQRDRTRSRGGTDGGNILERCAVAVSEILRRQGR